MRILQCASVIAESIPWVGRIASVHKPDIGVCTGTDIGAAPDIVDEIGIDLLFTPGDRDDRTTYEASYGRRYRIDPGYPYLDRTVYIGGTVLILLDTADGTVTTRQRLWLESVLTDTNADVVRGSVAPDVVLFTSYPVFSATTMRDPEALQELLLGFSCGPVRLSVCCSEGTEGSHTVVAGIHQYTTPRAEIGVRMIQIGRFQPIETVMIYRTEATGFDP